MSTAWKLLTFATYLVPDFTFARRALWLKHRAMPTKKKDSLPGVFYHPEPVPLQTRRVLPVFLPHAGCKHQCIFCAQETQTGIARLSLRNAWQDLRELLENRARREALPVEVAFYGGTFTALPHEWPLRFVELAASFKARNVVSAIRCSTRPDAVSPELLERLRDAGLHMVELGVQSFAPRALLASARGYAPEKAAEACRTVRDAGLELGIQLLPGLPGHKPGDFREDVCRTVALRPDLVRLYPCLVLSSAALALIWKHGRYRPWTVERAALLMGSALLMLWRAGIPVGRIGVAQEPGLEENILAGPWHKAMGCMARSAALFHMVCREVKEAQYRTGGPPRMLHLPRRYQGEFWGHKGRWRPHYARLGLPQDSLHVWDNDYFLLE